jgi:hypothetical protein
MNDQINQTDEIEETDVSQEQAAKLLEHIAMLATCMGRQLVNFEETDGSLTLCDRAYLMKQNLDQVGWMADLALAKLGTGQPMCGGAEEWFLSAGYEEAGKVS